MNLRRVATLAHKEWREILRDRLYLALAFVMPILLMFVFSYGISLDVRHSALAVIDHDRTDYSRAYTDRFRTSEYFDFKGEAEGERAIEGLFADGRARVVLVIPGDFQKDLMAGHPVAVQTFIDGSFTSTRPARALEGYVDAVNAAASFDLMTAHLARALGISRERAAAMLRPIELEVRYLYNPELRSIWSVAPSLIMFVTIFVAPMLMALGVVREKESGAIYNVYASTIRRSEFLAGKLVPNVAISFVNAAILWFIASVYFGAPFKGSVVWFTVGTFLYVLCATGIGLVLSLLVATQQAVLIIAAVVATIVGMQYSGMFTPVPSMTGFPWVLAHSFPAMYYLDVVEGSFLKGLAFSGLFVDLGVLAAFAVGYLLLAYTLFHKRLSSV